MIDDARKRLEQSCEGMEAHTMVEIDGKPSDFRIARVDDIRLLLAEVERLRGIIVNEVERAEHEAISDALLGEGVAIIRDMKRTPPEYSMAASVIREEAGEEPKSE